MSKSAPIPLKSINFDTAAAAADTVSRARNIPTLSFPKAEGGGEAAPASTVPAPSPIPASEAVKTASWQRIPVVLPDYVVADIKQRALGARSTQRFIVMQALKRGGIFIADEDMIEDGRRGR